MTGIETALIIGMVASAGMSAMGSIQQGNAAKSAANFNAAVHERNALISRQNAAAQAKRQEREGRLRAGANRAAVGASGIDLMGSAMDVLEDNAMEEELDRLTIIHQGELAASSSLANASLERARGAQAQRQGRMGAVSALLQGATSVAGSGAFGGLGGGTITVPNSTPGFDPFIA